ncbi:hypothetical protein EV702DRAFT_1202774 [Suillus placidus]|uniref:Uncharacterized protein n=1 Tax=Suillus placidus TaxID=48579 RepID=A0A9P7CYQ2_9AGAM|nr:hypothetical protein EV702DRAFT_1202774 [Suillus placidus]
MPRCSHRVALYSRLANLLFFPSLLTATTTSLSLLTHFSCHGLDTTHPRPRAHCVRVYAQTLQTLSPPLSTPTSRRSPHPSTTPNNLLRPPATSCAFDSPHPTSTFLSLVAHFDLLRLPVTLAQPPAPFRRLTRMIFPRPPAISRFRVLTATNVLQLLIRQAPTSGTEVVAQAPSGFAVSHYVIFLAEVDKTFKGESTCAGSPDDLELPAPPPTTFITVISPNGTIGRTSWKNHGWAWRWFRFTL